LTPPELLGWMKFSTGRGGVKIRVRVGRAAAAGSHGTVYSPVGCSFAWGAAEKYSAVTAGGRTTYVVPVSIHMSAEISNL
jgi:hypothetical protein